MQESTNDNSFSSHNKFTLLMSRNVRKNNRLFNHVLSGILQPTITAFLGHDLLMSTTLLSSIPHHQNQHSLPYASRFSSSSASRAVTIILPRTRYKTSVILLGIPGPMSFYFIPWIKNKTKQSTKEQQQNMVKYT